MFCKYLSVCLCVCPVNFANSKSGSRDALVPLVSACGCLWSSVLIKGFRYTLTSYGYSSALS